MGFALAAPDISDVEPAVIGWGVILAWYALIRTLRPITETGRLASFTEVLAEVAIHLLAVVATGYWDSPYVLSLVNAVVIGGFARGFGFAVQIGLGSAVAVGLPAVVNASDREAILREGLAWSTVLVLVAAVAGYAHRLFGAVEAQRAHAEDQLTQLARANALLLALNRVAQQLPATLDEGQVQESTLQRVHTLLDANVVVILLRNSADATEFTVASAEGVRLPPTLPVDALPPQARDALTDKLPTVVDDYGREEASGLSARSRSGLYAALPARDGVMGLAAVEHLSPGRYGERERQILAGFAEPAGLALDNARLFARLRTVAAEEERTRIARDLHDRVGQSLAYVAFELDRITRRGADTAIAADLESLRTDVRRVVTEVRETLYDIRSDVTESHDIVAAIRQYADRVAARSGLVVELDHEADSRLPAVQEREMWRIAQEAVTNAERHSGATTVRVVWRCDDRQALLEVADDGSGFDSEADARLDSYGLLGMRERADAIGAHLDIATAPGRGTTIRCRLERT